MTEWIDSVEAEIRAAYDRAEHERAATLIMERYGPEILGFLAAWLESREQATEAFSCFSEDLWTGLPSFRWRCSARGWAYTVARNAGRRVAKKERRRHFASLREIQGTAAIARQRSTTAAYLKTEVKDKMRLLRRRLPPEDQSLLILRVHRQLPWRELAIVLGRGGLHASDEALDREAARLRKRFHLATSRLRVWAREEGLLE